MAQPHPCVWPPLPHREAGGCQGPLGSPGREKEAYSSLRALNGRRGKAFPQEDPHSCRGVDWARGGGLWPREGPLKLDLPHPQSLEGATQPRVRSALCV